jgi:hypothetical protein
MDTFCLYSATLSGTDADDSTYVGNPTGEKLVIVAAYVEPTVAVATHASNYNTTTVKDSTGTTTVYSHTTNSSGGSALVAGTMNAMTLGAGVGTAAEIAVNGSVLCGVANSGTGPAYEQRVVLHCRKAR